MQHLGEICMAQRSRGKTSRISGRRRRVRDFQTAGLNGVFGYFCRREQKYPAPGRGTPLLARETWGRTTLSALKHLTTRHKSL